MRRKEYNKLLEFIDNRKISEPDWSLFSDRKEAESCYAELRNLQNNGGYPAEGFSPYFKVKVMGKIHQLISASETQSLDEILSRFFSKVMLAGTFTIIIVMLVLYVYHGHVGIETLTGIEQDSESIFISSLFNEF